MTGPAVIDTKGTTMTTTTAQRDVIADHLWNQMIGVAKSSVREVVADAFSEAGIEVADEAPVLEYTIAAISEDGAITQLADYTTVVPRHLNADLELYRKEEAEAGGDPERIIIAQRPIPKWARA